MIKREARGLILDVLITYLSLAFISAACFLQVIIKAVTSTKSILSHTMQCINRFESLHFLC